MRNFRPLASAGNLQRLVGRQLLHAVVQVAQTLDALLGHRVQQRLAVRAGLEAVDGLDVVEQEGQVEDLQLGRVLAELGQRRRNDLHVAQQQGFHFLAVAEQLAVGEHLHLDLAGELLGQFLELNAAWPLGVSSATTWLYLMTIG